jgi:L-arabinose transport system substrate-binding protein
MADPTPRGRRFLGTAIAVSALSLTIVAPAMAQDAPLFVAINKAADQQYFIDLQTSFKAKIEELGGTAQAYDAKLDPNLGVSLVNDAISAGAKGIAITVPDVTIGPAVAEAAATAGIALVATDDNISDAAGNPVPFVGFNGTDMGTKVGEAAGALLVESGWLDDPAVNIGFLLTQLETLPVCVDRTVAEKAKLIEAGLPEANVYPVNYDGTTTGAQDAAGPVITAHPDVTHWIVTSCNDEGVLGTLNALQTAGAAPENIIGVGLGAYEACKPWAAAQPSGFKAALFISGLDVGAAAAQALYDNVVNGVALPPETIASTAIVTPEDYATVFDPVSLANCSA